MSKHTEGDTRITTEKYTRIECEICEEPAIYRTSFLLSNARSNPASSGYGGDDISWCSDAEVFLCEEHKREAERDHCPEGMSFCSRMTFGERFAHVFHHWKKVGNDPCLEAAPDLREACNKALSTCEFCPMCGRDQRHGMRGNHADDCIMWGAAQKAKPKGGE
jgi:hypothetical protein